MMISTSVLDIARGRAGSRIAVELDYFITGQGWHEVGHGVTNDEGQVEEFGQPVTAGVFRLMFDVGAYFPNAFFPSVVIPFEVRDIKEHYHVAVLLSPFGFSAFRA